MTTPAVEVHLEYPRQTNATTSYNDINNLDDKIYCFTYNIYIDMKSIEHIVIDVLFVMFVILCISCMIYCYYQMFYIDMMML